MKKLIAYAVAFALALCFIFSDGWAQVPAVTVEIISEVTQCYPSNGIASASVEGETAGYSFQWTDEVTGEVVGTEALLEGAYSEYTTYYKVVATNLGTGLTSSPVIVTIPDLTIRSDEVFRGPLIEHNTNCSNPNGSVYINSSYDHDRYHIQWYHQNEIIAENQIQVNGLSPSSDYTLQITDQYTGCIREQEFEIYDETITPLIYLVNLRNASSCTASDGAIEVTAADGISSSADDYLFEWQANNSDEIFFGSYLTDLSPGEYTIRVTKNSTSCSSDYTFAVEPNYRQNEPAIAVTTSVCTGGEISFVAEGRDELTETYSWQIVRINNDATEITYGLPDSIRIAKMFKHIIDQPGDYLARVTLSNECTSDTVLTQSFTIPTVAEITLPESINLCRDSVSITVIDPADDDGSYTFAWVQQGAVEGGNLPDQNTISVAEEGYYSVTVTNAEGCVSEGEVLVVDSRPDVELPEDFTLCQNEERELDVEIPSPGTPGYEWVVLNEAGASVFTSNEPVLEVSETTPDAGMYTYTVTDDSPEGCFVRDTVVVTILPLDLVSIEQNANELSASLSDQAAYRWFLDGKILPDTTQSITVSNNGNYTVEVTNNFRCTSVSEPFTVVVTNLSTVPEFSELEIFPNPSQDIFWISIDQPSVLRVTDIRGNVIYRQQAWQPTSIDLSAYPTGVYLLQIVTRSKPYVCRLYKK